MTRSDAVEEALTTRILHSRLDRTPLARCGVPLGHSEDWVWGRGYATIEVMRNRGDRVKLCSACRRILGGAE